MIFSWVFLGFFFQEIRFVTSPQASSKISSKSSSEILQRIATEDRAHIAPLISTTLKNSSTNIIRIFSSSFSLKFPLKDAISEDFFDREPGIRFVFHLGFTFHRFFRKLFFFYCRNFYIGSFKYCSIYSEILVGTFIHKL